MHRFMKLIEMNKNHFSSKCFLSVHYVLHMKMAFKKLITFLHQMLCFHFLCVPLRRLSTQTERLMLNLKNTTNMDKIIILPDIAEAEVRIKVPPIVKEQPRWSGILKKIGSLFTKQRTEYHDQHKQKLDELPICIIGCDIKRINNIIITPDYESRD